MLLRKPEPEIRSFTVGELFETTSKEYLSQRRTKRLRFGEIGITSESPFVRDLSRKPGGFGADLKWSESQKKYLLRGAEAGKLIKDVISPRI